ncbi:TetR/AcrR family transcriptional regulator [Clostridioides sp. ZZV15-6598]|uniref:TetR/AcrR family transcriptional regulator n=1 Tax=Clostridioides sp. ZZV15-6598 TaxID=2811501 RepID=UPI001D12ECB2|nr:TetR/AcrR family transcriptional regulator [Clostridioides sp. ZZV15-6598]
MNRENKKESVAKLHRNTIIQSAKEIFTEKGFIATTIDDISKKSQYSRRTLYSYFESKEDILNHIVLDGLITLREDITKSISNHIKFLDKYKAICNSMKYYYLNNPHSFNAINNQKPKDINFDEIPPVVVQIFTVGTDINNLLENYIKEGIRQGIVMKSIKPMQTVYILWASISSLLSLASSKNTFIEKEFDTSIDNFLDYGFTQIINSILEVRV